MSCYNLTKAADRTRYREDHQAELDAVHAGSWPRDLNDQMRWINDSSAGYAARCCKNAINAINDIEQRLLAGDPSLEGWEGWVVPAKTA